MTALDPGTASATSGQAVSTAAAASPRGQFTGRQSGPSDLVPGFDLPFFLGGMAGYGDGPFRMLCRELGCPFAVTEAMQASTLVQGGRGLRKADPDRSPLGDEKRREDHPLAGQILGADPAEMAHAARLLVELGYEVIDLNFACPAKKKKGAVEWGGRLLDSPDRGSEILHAVREAVPDHVPLSLKMRRSYREGPASEDDFLRLFETAGQLDFAWVTVHCRTVEQRYDGPGHWPFLTRLREAFPTRRLFGSGDIWTAEDAIRMLEITGVDAVSVARGAIRDPWIFRRLRQYFRPVDEPSAGPQGLSDAAALGRVLRHLLERSVLWHGEREAARRFRKLALPMTDLHPEPAAWRSSLIRSRHLGDLRAALNAGLPLPDRDD